MDGALRIENEDAAWFEGAPHRGHDGEEGVADDFQIIFRRDGEVGELFA